MIRAAALAALAIVAALPAVAQTRLDLPYRYDPGYLWLDRPNTTDNGSARMRIVFAGRDGAAALTPNQWWRYSELYKRSLARLVMRGVRVDRAEPQARYEAFVAVVRQYPDLTVSGFGLDRITAEGGRVGPHR